MSINRDKTKEDIKDIEKKSKEELLEFQYQNPAQDTSENTDSHIGNWHLSAYAPTSREKIAEELKNAATLDKRFHTQGITFTKIENIDDDKGYLGLYYNKYGTVTINTFNKNIFEEYQKFPYPLFVMKHIEGNQIFIYQSAVHEFAHRDHDLLDNQELLEDYSTKSRRANRLTETIACATSFLNAAYYYTWLKDQGLKTITFNNNPTPMPIEEIIAAYPGLKEYIDTNGFNKDKPGSIRGVVEIASKYWHENRQELYDIQANTKTLTDSMLFEMDEQNKKFSTLLNYYKNNNKQYDIVAKNMLKDVYIGYNAKVDLSNCRDLLDTMTEEHAQKIMTEYEYTIDLSISKEEILDINNYLESLGLKTDKQKDKYMEKFIKNATMRSKDTDKELEKIVLSYENTAQYTDGISATYDKDKTYLSLNKTTATINNKETPKTSAKEENQTQPSSTAAPTTIKREHTR